MLAFLPKLYVLEDVGETLQETVTFEGASPRDRLQAGLSAVLSLIQTNHILVREMGEYSITRVRVTGEPYDPARHHWNLRSNSIQLEVTHMDAPLDSSAWSATVLATLS